MTAWRKWIPRRPAADPQPAPSAPGQDDTAAAEPVLEDQEPGDAEDLEDADDGDQEERKPWWSSRPAPDQPNPDPAGPQTWTVSPGVQVTINQPPQAPSAPASTSLWRLRTRRWLLRHGAAAGVGWMFGLYQSMAALLDSPERGGAAAGLGLAGIGWLFAEIVTDRLGRHLPARLRAAVRWTARIPFATALLVTALHAPNAVL
jgi:hypothetical protein